MGELDGQGAARRCSLRAAARRNLNSLAHACRLPLRRGRVTFKAFTKVSNAVEFTLNKEDHTLGNTLRMCAPRKESPANPLLPCR
jgi:hypothetical protein